MEWTTENVIQLIDEYEKFPILWDPKNEHHFNRNKKFDAWEYISRNVNAEVGEVKQKISSLLGSFRREKAKGKRSIGTEKGRAEIYASKLFAFERMSFLLDKDEPRATINTEQNISEVAEIENPENENVVESENLNSQETQDNQIITEVQLQESQFPAPTPHKVMKTAKKQQKSANQDPRVEEAFQILKRSVATTASTIPLDESAAYGAYLGNKLRSYTVKTRNRVEHEINNILYEADNGKYESIVQYSNILYNNVPSFQHPVFHQLQSSCSGSPSYPSPSNTSISDLGTEQFSASQIDT